MINEIILVDYENVQSISTIEISEEVLLLIVIGIDQNKIPIDVVQKIQRYGNQVKWIKVNGRGKNALDFFIAFYLGRYVEKDSKLTFKVFSKDKGYDPLINHLVSEGICIYRIEKFDIIAKEKTQIIKTGRSDYEKVLINLQNMEAEKRPKKKEKLVGHVKTIFGNKKSEEVILKIIYQLNENGIILFDEKANIKYKL
jgi:hypothetical protein